MSHAMQLNKQVLRLLPSDLSDKRIIDIASGFGSWGYQLRIKEKNLPYLVGLDVWVPYMELLKSLKIYSSLVLADARHLPFRGGSFQLTLACEIIEHLTYDDGMILIDELERIIDGMIIISTPKGYMYQDEINGNPFEKHVSAWREFDFNERGFSSRTIEALPLPRTLRLVDRIRRWVFKLRPALVEIIAFKEICKNNIVKMSEAESTSIDVITHECEERNISLDYDYVLNIKEESVDDN